MLRRGLLSAALLLVAGLCPSVAHAAFTFTFGDPTQCDNLNISWTGGTAPFELQLVPVFATPRNISIPSSAFSDGKGSFQTQLPLPGGQQFVMVMSDANGYATGGITDLLTVGSSVGGSSCNTTDPGVSFDYQLNSALQQCRTYTFSEYTDAIQPVEILGIIPGGDYFIVNPPKGPSSYDWTATVKGGTSVIFIITDSQGRQGGASDVRTASGSDDATCLNSNYPSSTANPPSESTSSSATSTQSSSDKTTTVSGGTIAASVIGGLVALAAIVTLGLFFLLRKRRDTPYSRRRHSQRLQSVDLMQGPPPPSFAASHSNPNLYPFPYSPNTSSEMLPRTSAEASVRRQHRTSSYPLEPSDQYQPTPFTEAFPSMASRTEPTASTPATPATSRQAPRTSVSSAGRRKASLAGLPAYQPPRYVVHIDAEEILPDENGVVELPPQYSERRRPMNDIVSESDHGEGPSSQPPPLPPPPPIPPHLGAYAS